MKMMEIALGEESFVTLEALSDFGERLYQIGEFEEAREVSERCLALRLKVSGEDHKDTLTSLDNLGIIYNQLKNREKALEYYERVLKVKEKTARMNNLAL